jgi:hypothetical protein
MCERKALRGRTFSILGDSYSTFRGFVPEGNRVYYPNPQSVPDVQQVEQTWWHILMGRTEMTLLHNDSFSGATVCTHVRDGHPREEAFAVRVHSVLSHRDDNGRGPDYLFVFGCTNDSWQKRTVGQLQYENWTEQDLRCVLPAYCYVLDAIRRELPDTRVVSVINTGMDPAVTEGMQKANDDFGVLTVMLREIDKQKGHPSALGMQQIAKQIEEML